MSIYSKSLYKLNITLFYVFTAVNVVWKSARGVCLCTIGWLCSSHFKSASNCFIFEKLNKHNLIVILFYWDINYKKKSTKLKKLLTWSANSILLVFRSDVVSGSYFEHAHNKKVTDRTLVFFKQWKNSSLITTILWRMVCEEPIRVCMSVFQCIFSTLVCFFDGFLSRLLSYLTVGR